MFSSSLEETPATSNISRLESSMFVSKASDLCCDDTVQMFNRRSGDLIWELNAAEGSKTADEMTFSMASDRCCIFLSYKLRLKPHLQMNHSKKVNNPIMPLLPQHMSFTNMS